MERVASLPRLRKQLRMIQDIQGRRDTFQNCRDGKMVPSSLDAGAVRNVKTVTGYRALLGAAVEGNVAATEALLKTGANLSSTRDGGLAPESESCDRGGAGKFRVCTLAGETLKSKTTPDWIERSGYASTASLRVHPFPNGSSSDRLCAVNSSAPFSVMCMSSSRRIPNSPRT